MTCGNVGVAAPALRLRPALVLSCGTMTPGRLRCGDSPAAGTRRGPMSAGTELEYSTGTVGPRRRGECRLRREGDGCAAGAASASATVPRMDASKVSAAAPDRRVSWNRKQSLRKGPRNHTQFQQFQQFVASPRVIHLLREVCLQHLGSSSRQSLQLLPVPSLGSGWQPLLGGGPRSQVLLLREMRGRVEAGLRRQPHRLLREPRLMHAWRLPNRFAQGTPVAAGHASTSSCCSNAFLTGKWTQL